MNKDAAGPLSRGRAHSARYDAADAVAGQITARVPADMVANMRRQSGICYRAGTDVRRGGSCLAGCWEAQTGVIRARSA